MTPRALTLILITLLSAPTLGYADPIRPVSGECVGDACGVAELHIASDGCVRIKNDSNRYVEMTFYLVAPPESMIEVRSRAGQACIGDFVGQYQLRFFDPMS